MSDDNYPQTSTGNDVYLATRKKTQKKKVMRTNDDKSKLWSIYDNDKLSASVEGSQNESKPSFECVYAKDAETCNICKSH